MPSNETAGREAGLTDEGGKAMSDDDAIRVLVVDDQDLVRSGFKAIIGTLSLIHI